jgi:DNA-binding NtrC family response regulator
MPQVLEVFVVKSQFKILLVEDMASFRDAVTQLLGVYNDVEEAVDLASARAKLRTNTYDVVILDKGLPDGDGIELISEIKEGNASTVVIILTSDSDFSSVKHCIARGADDYVIKSPNIVPDLLVRIPVAVSKAASSRRLDHLEQLVKEAFRYEIVGKSPSTMELREMILSLKGLSATVLITGESGTGKELIARRLNSIEADGKRPFVAINCGAIAENLIESELFGHKKGSFTGALHDRIGKFEYANGGDLFLDEIGELPLNLQARLLRVLQEGEVVRVGDNRAIRVSCRIIAATNQNLEKMVKAGKFREDLYHRLNVVRVTTTPLRSRTSDIADLAQLFTLQVGGAPFKITDRAIKVLSEYDWPGNIRELRNAIERAIISARRRKSFKVDFDDVTIHSALVDANYRQKKIEASFPSEISELSPKSFKEFSESLEKEYFETALELMNGNVEALANTLGLGRSTVFKKMRELGIILERSRPTQSARPKIQGTTFPENTLTGGHA